MFLWAEKINFFSSIKQLEYKTKTKIQPTLKLNRIIWIKLARRKLVLKN